MTGEREVRERGSKGSSLAFRQTTAQKRKKRIAVRIVDLTCPSCGAKIKRTTEFDDSIISCEYCGSRITIDSGTAFGKIAYIPIKPPGPNPKEEAKNRLHTTLVMVFSVVCFIFLILTTLIDSKKEKEEKEQIMVTPKIEYDLPVKMEYEVREVSWHTQTYGRFLEEVFGKSIADISEEELSKIQWIEQRYENDYYRIGYSFEEPQQENSQLEYLFFSREEGLGEEALSLMKGLKKIDVFHDVSGEDLKGLHPISIGSYVNDPKQLASLLEAPEMVKEIFFHAGVDSLEGLEEFINLERLYIDSSEITNLDPLASLSNLKELHFESMEGGVDISVLETLKELTSLSLDIEDIRSLSFVRNIKNLDSLAIHSGSLLNLEGLESAEKLTKLSVVRCFEIKDMSSIENLLKLEKLELELPYDCKEPNLSKLNNLKELHVEGFRSGEYLSGMKELEKLSIKWCNFESFPDLSTLPLLRELTYYSENPITTTIDFLMGAESLESLDISGIQVYEDISPIFAMNSLKELNISGIEAEWNFENTIQNTTLEKLTMDNIYLYENIVTGGSDGFYWADWDEVILEDGISVISKFTELRELSIRDNKLTNLEFIRELGKLKYLDLSDNYVADLRPLTGIGTLKTIICSGNPISNFEILDKEIEVIKE